MPLQKWWHKVIENGTDPDGSYRWVDDPAMRFKDGWCYAIYTRADQPYSKFKETAFKQKVSFYGTSSPAEWFAEQYAHYYRTEKTGGGLIDSDTKALLDRLDNEAWAPGSTDAGIQYTTSLNKAGEGGGARGGGGAGAGAARTGGGVAEAGAAASGAAPAPGGAARTPAPRQPLFFPW